MATTAKVKRRPAFGDEMVPIIRVAGQQLDAEPGGRLGWLLRFVREDPATWLPGDRESHGYRLLALVYGPLPDSLLQLGSGNIPPLTPGSVEDLHAELHAFFRDLVTVPAGVVVKVPTDDLQQSFIRATAPGIKPAIFATDPRGGGPRRTVLFQVVKDLILKEGDRLIQCPECKEPFLALRKKKFCKGECLQRWHDREKIARRKKERGR